MMDPFPHPRSSQQNRLRKDFFYKILYERPYFGSNSVQLYNAAKNNRYLLQRLKCLHTLNSHAGCVNTITWNSTGQYILSGSDDLHLSITNAFSGEIKAKIRTGHATNIFSAKYLPNTSDTKVVSCSGDGVIIYTDLNRPETAHLNIFDCQEESVYDIVTVPSDPNTFLTCSHDHTVRWYDLRVKQSCQKHNRTDRFRPKCRDDVLINCEYPVTAIAVNHLLPWQLAVGCSDSIIRIYDRRMLTTKTLGGSDLSFADREASIIAKFTYDEIKDLNRITSLAYSKNCQQILASYSNDNLYLFNLNEVKNTVCNGTDSDVIPQKLKKKQSPYKRFRLRGDWSDTGPSSLSNESNQQNNTSSSSSNSSTNSRNEMDNTLRIRSQRLNQLNNFFNLLYRQSFSDRLSENADEDNNNNPDNSNNQDDDDDDAGDGDDDDDDDDDDTVSDTVSASDLGLNLNLNEPQSQSTVTATTTATSTTSAEANRATQSTSNASASTSNSTMTRSSILSSTPKKATTTTENAIIPSSESDQNTESTSDSATAVEDQPMETEFESNQSATSSGTSGTETGTVTGNENSIENSSDSYPTFFITISDGNVNDVTFFRNSDERQQGGTSTSTGGISGTGDNDNERQNHSMSDEDDDDFDWDSDNVFTQEQTNHNFNTNSSGSRHRSRSSSSNESQSRRKTTNPSTINPKNNTNNANNNNKQKITIQNSQQYSTNEISWNRIVSKEKRLRTYKIKNCKKFVGHRNCRTVIKEATFWGDDFIISGSDCGHIFFWSIETGEVVMILEGDHHVVNCLQPHPTDPILASSGIDYDIKIWGPDSETSLFDPEKAKKIMSRNKQLLDESWDTVTVPARFVISFFSTIQRQRGRDRRSFSINSRSTANNSNQSSSPHNDDTWFSRSSESNNQDADMDEAFE